MTVWSFGSDGLAMMWPSLLSRHHTTKRRKISALEADGIGRMISPPMWGHWLVAWSVSGHICFVTIRLIRHVSVLPVKGLGQPSQQRLPP